MGNIYMDYAVTTYIKPEVLEEMMPFFTKKYGNPSSFYGISRETKMAIDKARGRVSKALDCDSNEICFTGGGSEADNWTIKGIALAHRKKENHVMTTKVKHHVVLHACEYLGKNGFRVTYLNVDKEGLIDLEELKSAITNKTILVLIIFANNEMGAIQPVREIGEIYRERKVLFHTGAVQAIGSIPVDVKEMNTDLLSLAEHRVCGPKGIGALYIRKGVRVDNLIHSGGQRRTRGAGTENTVSIVGIGEAIELATKGLKEYNKEVTKLRDRLIDSLLKVPHTRLNGPGGEKRLPGNADITFEFIEGKSILLSPDFEGVYALSDSTCISRSFDPSHVLLAMGLPYESAHGSLRLTLGDGSTDEDVDYVLEVAPPIIERLRNMSPLWEDFLKKGERYYDVR